MSFLGALLRGFLHAAATHCFQVDCRRQRNQSFVCADIGSGFLAPNVLFARRHRREETTTALLVESFSDQTPRNLSRVFFARREQSHVRSAKRNGHTERLTFGHDNISAASAR